MVLLVLKYGFLKVILNLLTKYLVNTFFCLSQSMIGKGKAHTYAFPIIDWESISVSVTLQLLRYKGRYLEDKTKKITAIYFANLKLLVFVATMLFFLFE